jgi:hypothetical protein
MRGTVYFISGSGAALFFWVILAFAAFGVGKAVLDDFFGYNIPNTPKSTKLIVSCGIGVAPWFYSSPPQSVHSTSVPTSSMRPQRTHRRRYRALRKYGEGI